MRAGALAVALALAAGAALADEAASTLRALDPAELAYTYAVGAFRPEYTAPAPGTYALPVIDTVQDHPLLDVDGARTRLFALKEDRVAVVAFVYTTCVEAAGCPLSMAVLHRLDRALADDETLAGRVTLLTISFDPERDDPARMATVRAAHAPRGDWRFATTEGEAELEPLLADFGQRVDRLRFGDGRWTGLFRHVLKVYLVDGRNRVRNIYSAGFLNPDLVLNDVRTILMEPAG